MNYLKRCSLFFVLIFLAGSLWGQQDKFEQEQDSLLPCMQRDFSVEFFVVNDTTGADALTTDMQTFINQTMAEVNTYFAPGCISFNICGLNQIDNWQFDTIRNMERYDQLLARYKKPNRINVFMVSTIELDTTDACGYTPVNAIANDSSAIIFRKEPSLCMAPNLAHLIGHYFGLYNTFETMNGEEKVARVDCDSLGDGICDTPADNFDPNDQPDQYVDETLGCRFTDSSLDEDGQYYDPDVGNIMSGYQNTCRKRFTKGQFNKMFESYLEANPRPW